MVVQILQIKINEDDHQYRKYDVYFSPDEFCSQENSIRLLDFKGGKQIVTLDKKYQDYTVQFKTLQMRNNHHVECISSNILILLFFLAHHCQYFKHKSSNSFKKIFESLWNRFQPIFQILRKLILNKIKLLQK
ncbi:unnamed protein product [Paramecium sonneborni]|uniref:Uncharacterized protein n=1 Tax=Paramecium sonneborni TaxID=65129 RepID=A0A8S1RS04_9CILI|nr:unnamed protein product [Paramecium sonneborni]